MNLKKNIITIFIGLLCIVFTKTDAISNDINIDGDVLLHHSIKEDLLIERINSITSLVDVKITPELKKIIRQYTLKHRKSSEIVLGKAPIFFPLFENILREENLPMELKYLSVVESGLKPDAKSAVGAMGLWQFMKGTGKMYGLKINSTIDQRKDPTLSTRAAAKFLKDLYEQFDNWTLALAAYNCGPGNVRKAIRKSGSRDFWVLQKYLPKETRRYIPKFIAMVYLHEYYEAYNLVPRDPKLNFNNVLRLPVEKSISFKKLRKITGLSISKIKYINPAYLKNYIPANGTNYINLPQEHMFMYLQHTGELNKDLYSFSGDYKTSFAVKIADKPTKIDNRLKEIATLDLLIKNELYSVKETEIEISDKSIYTTNFKTSQIKKGETLKDLANRLQLNIDDLITWNSISVNNMPKPGAIVYLESCE